MLTYCAGKFDKYLTAKVKAKELTTSFAQLAIAAYVQEADGSGTQ